MPRIAWSDDENALIVKDYFEMLQKESAGKPYKKAEHRRALMPKLSNRTNGSIEYKHQNISAALRDLGENWIRGYQPAFDNIQKSLLEEVVRWLNANRDWEFRLPTTSNHHERAKQGELSIGPPPTLSNQMPHKIHEETLKVVKDYNVAERNERNRKLGEAGEELVYEYERSKLYNAGHHSLSKEVRWVSKEDGDGAGYDILSFLPDGTKRRIEVKTTNGWERTPFYITKNELEKSQEYINEWHLFRLWDFQREPRAFELRPPLDRHVSLIATTYRAVFDGSGNFASSKSVK